MNKLALVAATVIAQAPLSRVRLGIADESSPAGDFA